MSIKRVRILDKNGIVSKRIDKRAFVAKWAFVQIKPVFPSLLGSHLMSSLLFSHYQVED